MIEYEDMTLQQIYELGIEMAIEADPRGVGGVKKYLERVKTQYDSLPENKKKAFDKESLTNPYSDSRIGYGDPKTVVKKAVVGIDGDGTEILLADRLNQKGEKIDLVISHHPNGVALAGLHEVLDMQSEMVAKMGVPINVAHSLFQKRKTEVRGRLSPANHNQSVDTARLLDVPLLWLHTVTDNLVSKFLEDHFEGKEFYSVGEVLDYVNEIPEFIESTKGKAGPFIASGSENSRAGKVFAGHNTGGTNGPKEIYQELAKSGVGTLVEMHVKDDAIKELQKLHINVVDIGHIAADSIGINLFLDEIEKRGVKIVPFSGLIRVKRK